MNEVNRLFKLFMGTEGVAIHTEPREVFKKLNMDKHAIADLFIEILEGPPNAFEARMDDALGELTVRLVHQLVDDELRGE